EGYFTRIPTADYSPTWYAQRQPGGTMSAHCANTPALAYLDSLGRTFLSIDDNGPDAHGNPQKFPAHSQLDVQGNQLSVTDALGRTVMTYVYGMLKNKLQQSSMEGGKRWMLADVSAKALLIWNSRFYRFRQVYDTLERPLQMWVSLEGGKEVLLQFIIYGESISNAIASNLLGKTYQSFDQSGLVANSSYDFKGNLLSAVRRFAANYKVLSGQPCAVDWSAVANGTQPPDSQLETETLESSMTYDALNRPITWTSPDSSVILPVFNEANLLESLSVQLQGGTATTFITNLNYDAKGQRTLCQYGSGVQTTYTYDPETFRLTNFTTIRPTAGSTNGATDTLQDLNYYYDPVGNVIEVDD
ncbi:MAG TPA: toxin, partial [bacterium]|nr:toxin [bacterium]